jgi:hypothetical protein
LAPAELDTLQKEHNTYFEKEGVTITGASDTVKQEVKGKAWSFTELKAKSKDGESIIRYIAINPNVASGKIIMMTYWASPEGHKTHDAADVGDHRQHRLQIRSLRVGGTAARPTTLSRHLHPMTIKGLASMRSIILWLVGVPIPIIILLWFFMR